MATSTVLESAPTASPVRRLGDAVARSISRHERRYLLLTISIFGLLTAYSAAVTPLWFDEFFTFFISGIRPFRQMLQAMPADSQPPLQYLLTAFCVRTFGASEFVIRFPEFLAYLATGLLTWRIVRRHGTAVQALFATAAIFGTTTGGLLLSGWAVKGIAFTARPYQLVLAFTSLSFACWQSAALRQRDRLLPLIGLSCGIAGAVLTHHLALLQIGMFLAAGELTRFLRRRRIDGAMLTAIATGLVPLIITAPLAAQTHRVLDEAIRHSTNFGGRPSGGDFLFWPLMIPWFPLLPVLLLACRPSRARSNSNQQSFPDVPSHEWFAAIALAMILPAQIAVAILVTGYSMPRYGIGTSLGLALLFAWGAPRLGYLRVAAKPALALITLGYLTLATGSLGVAQLRNPVWRAQPSASAVPPILTHAPGNLPIVSANAFDYVQQWWYSPPPLRQRLIYLSDLPYAERQPGFLAELSLIVDGCWMPFPVVQYKVFLNQHPGFLLVSSGNPKNNWISARLSNTGWHLTRLAQDRQSTLYQVEHP